MMNHLLLAGVFLVTMLTVNADFTLTINFINYTNPSGLCAECNTTLANVPLDQIVPVCCDQTSQTDNCVNTGEESCDTRFRWTLREFGASIETRPVTILMAFYPSYFFNPCTIPTSMCPFNETNRTFDQGNISFLGRPNPYIANSTGPWMGRIQFYIEPNGGVPNIIDSIPVNLDTLQLGADFTEEMTYTGYHKISHMRMSFKVECSPDYCGPDCNVSSVDNPRIMSCASNGQITCVNGYNHEVNCTACLPGWNMSTNCTTRLSGYTGEDCMADAVNAALVGGIAGGVGGGALIIIVLLILIIILLACRNTSAKFNVSNGNADNVYEHSRTDTGTGTPSVERKFQNPIYGSGLESSEVVYSDPTPLRTATIINDEDMVPNPVYNYFTSPQHELYSYPERPTDLPPVEDWHQRL